MASKNNWVKEACDNKKFSVNLLVKTQARARNQQQPMLNTSGSNKPEKQRKLSVRIP